jgi:thimet oligopeptidase
MSFTLLSSPASAKATARLAEALARRRLFSVRVHVHGRHTWRPFVCTLVAAYVLAGTVAGQPVRFAPLAQGGPAAPPREPVDSPFSAGATDVASLQRSIDARLSRAQQLLTDLVTVKGQRTVANTLEPYDELFEEIHTASALAGLMASVHPDESMRKVGTDLQRTADSLEADISLRPEVFRALQGVRLEGADVESRYYVERTIRELRRLGVDRPAPTRTRLKGLRDELTVLMAEYVRNIRNGGRRFSVSAQELDGLPADFLGRHKPDASGAITLTSDIVDLRPVLTYATSEDLRKRMYIESSSVAHPANVAVLAKMLTVRAEIARLLGYPTWASYDMSSRMSGDVKTVSSFIDRVVAAARAKANQEYDELLKLKRQTTPGSTLNVWDRQYFSEQVRKRSYDFDSQSVRPYFAASRVLQGVLDVSSRIFAVTYRPVTGVAVWHPSVRVYEMLDEGRLLGRLYLDLYPRPGKLSSAFTLTVRQGAANKHIPEAVLVASMPGGRADEPGLMTHDEVRTLFHEFGHVVHRLVGGHRMWYGMSSIHIERDFTEAPSQMLEEWIWDPATLATFATHYQTGEPIPARLVMQMRRASEFGQGLDVRSQMVFARGLLSLHDRDPKRVDATALFKEIHNRYLPYSFVDGTYRELAIPQLANPGYASAYYTYMWSLVIAKDLLTGFDKNNLSAPGAARRYRDTIFAPGSSKPAADLVRDFLRRPFNANAWEDWLNRETPVGTN